MHSSPPSAKFGTFGPSHRLFRHPVFLQRVVEVTTLVGLAMLLPLLADRSGVRSVGILAAIVLILCSFMVRPLQTRPWLLTAVTLGAGLLIGLLIPQDPRYLGPMHLIMHAVLVRIAPNISWPLAIGSALFYEAVFIAVKTSWELSPALANVLLPTTASDTAAKLVLVFLAKSWHELHAAMRKSALELTAVTGSSCDLIALIDRSGTIRSINGACRQLLGFEPEEITGESYRNPQVLPGAPSLDVMADLINSGQPVFNVMKQLTHKDGSTVWIEWNLEPVPELDALLCVGRNVTERQKGQI